MSKFSGKCDFCDLIVISGLEKVLKSNIYIGKSKTPLVFNSEKDLIPYYPYIVTAMYTGDTRIIRLSSESWVDTEEREFKKYRMSNNMFKEYRERLKEEIAKYED